MNAQELFLKDGVSAQVYYCSECKIVAKKKEDADSCCKRSICKYCGNLVEEKFWLAHQECIEKNKIEKAEKLDIWDGWVFYDDKYYTTLEELLEELEDMEESIPEYVYVCKEISFPGIKIDRLIEAIEEDSYEEVIESISGLDTLADAINDFNEDNKGLVSYLPDETKMVRVKEYLNACKKPKTNSE